jgi:hypothetical protein
MEPSPDTDLHWLAFRYVCGELTGDESVALEARLAHDLAAQEAVAEAVELVGAVGLAASSARPTILPIRPARTRRIMIWAIPVSAAACLLLAFGLNVLGHRKPAAGPLASHPSALVATPTRDVALAWSGLRREEGIQPSDQTTWPVESSGIAELELLPVAEEGESSPPSWLVAAASLRETPTPDASETKEN